MRFNKPAREPIAQQTEVSVRSISAIQSVKKTAIGSSNGKNRRGSADRRSSDRRDSDREAGKGALTTRKGERRQKDRRTRGKK